MEAWHVHPPLLRTAMCCSHAAACRNSPLIGLRMADHALAHLLALWREPGGHGYCARVRLRAALCAGERCARQSQQPVRRAPARCLPPNFGAAACLQRLICHFCAVYTLNLKTFHHHQRPHGLLMQCRMTYESRAGSHLISCGALHPWSIVDVDCTQGILRNAHGGPVASTGAGHHRRAAVLPGVHARRGAQGPAGREQVCAGAGAGAPASGWAAVCVSAIHFWVSHQPLG